MSKQEELDNAKAKLKECVEVDDFKLAMIYCEFAISLQEAIRVDRKRMMEQAYYKAAYEHEVKRGLELKAIQEKTIGKNEEIITSYQFFKQYLQEGVYKVKYKSDTERHLINVYLDEERLTDDRFEIVAIDMFGYIEITITLLRNR